MNLKSFGCSFIYGTDLHDTDSGNSDQFSHFTWPALCAEYLNYDYHCYAYPGSGNLQILDTLLNVLPDAMPAVYIIGWTWIDRFDYIDSASDRQNWKTILPGDCSTVNENYYKNLHNQYSDKLTTLICIKTAIDVLQQYQVPFIMTYIDELLFETHWHISPGITALQNYIRPHMTRFNGKDFLTWSRENGHTISKTMHPMESAHKSAADYIIDQGLL